MFFLKLRSANGQESDGKDEEESGKVAHPLVTLTKIDPDEIPDVPSNRFLYRSEKKKGEEDDSKETKKRLEWSSRPKTFSGSDVSSRKH